MNNTYTICLQNYNSLLITTQESPVSSDDKTKEAEATELEVQPRDERAIGFFQALAIPVSHWFVYLGVCGICVCWSP